MPALHAAQAPDPSPDIDYPRIGLISSAHLINDLYGNSMTSLTPYLVLSGRISLTMAGFVLLVYLFGSSVLQPLFGLMSDRTGRRYFVVFGPLWVGAAASLFGWASGAGPLLGLAAVGGLGTAAFHPQAASLINDLSRRSKGWSMSLFSMGGNVGFAFGPLLAAGIAAVGLHWSIVIIVPGILLTVLLAVFAPNPAPSSTRSGTVDVKRSVRRSWRPMGLIISVIAIRSGVQYALIIFLPLYFHARGFPTQLGSYYAFVLSLAGALGGLLGGHLSDRHGRKIVVVGSLVASAPLLLASLLVQGIVVWLLLALAGAALLASNSVTVVQGQELLPGNAGIASGLTLGLGFGLSGVIASFLTTLSAHIGVGSAIFVVPFLALLAAGVAALVPNRSADPRASGRDVAGPALAAGDSAS